METTTIWRARQAHPGGSGLAAGQAECHPARYETRTRRATDIDGLCQKQKKHVNSLSVEELFDNMWQNRGKSGEVLRCLKANLSKIANNTCATEVKRIVAVHSESPVADPTHSQGCASDISEFCAKVEPVFVHLCLRRNLLTLSAPCMKNERVQGSAKAGDITLKRPVRVACPSLCAPCA